MSSRRVRCERRRQLDAALGQGHGADSGIDFEGQCVEAVPVGRGPQVHEGGDDVPAVRGGAVEFADGVDNGRAGAQFVVDQDNGVRQGQCGAARWQELVGSGVGMRLLERTVRRHSPGVMPGGVNVVGAQLCGDQLSESGGGFRIADGHDAGEVRLLAGQQIAELGHGGGPGKPGVRILDAGNAVRAGIRKQIRHNYVLRKQPFEPLGSVVDDRRERSCGCRAGIPGGFQSGLGFEFPPDQET